MDPSEGSAVAGAADATVTSDVALALTGAKPAVARGAGDEVMAHAALATVVDGVGGLVLGSAVRATAAGGAVGAGDGGVDGVGHQFSSG